MLVDEGDKHASLLHHGVNYFSVQIEEKKPPGDFDYTNRRVLSVRLISPTVSLQTCQNLKKSLSHRDC
jgi:hypothetical protein